jgi:hypothetical protein
MPYGTGSFISGSLSMFFFALGTLPLMFIIGAISSLLSSKFTKNMMKASAVLVVVLGFTMLNRGITLSGIEFTKSNNTPQTGKRELNATTTNLPEVINNIQEITNELNARRYPNITVAAGIPVKWTIHAEENSITGCNNELVIQKYGIRKKLVPGDNIIEFTPDKEGTVTYSCWMGMIKAKITIVTN